MPGGPGYNMPVNPYLDLTREFNTGGLRAIVSSGQAVVLLRLSVSSKDGDWIVRETLEALEHMLTVLARHGARYRFGAPLDVRWMQGGWSAHLEFQGEGLRLGTDFVTRPPRLSPEDLGLLWQQQDAVELPCVDPRRLIALKQTGRERDYAIIGELARLLSDPHEQLLASRSPDDLVALARTQRLLTQRLCAQRPLLEHALRGEPRALATALDAERRGLMEADVARLSRYRAASVSWAQAWPALQREMDGQPLLAQHALMAARAFDLLPFVLPGGPA